MRLEPLFQRKACGVSARATPHTCKQSQLTSCDMCTEWLIVMACVSVKLSLLSSGDDPLLPTAADPAVDSSSSGRRIWNDFDFPFWEAMALKQESVRIIIADDHPVFRFGLRQIIEAEPGFDVVGEADHGEDALEIIGKIHPAIAILDVSMPRLDGLALARQLQKQEHPVKTILVTMYREEKLYKRAIEAGVKGYVLKDSSASDIISCIKAVVAGQDYASPELTTYLVSRVRQVAEVEISGSEIESLTIAERRILALLAEYKTSKEIAQELFVSPRTIETHRNNICQKLGIHGSHALMKFALAQTASPPSDL